MIFREEDFSEEEFRSVALLVERRFGDCGRNDDGTFGLNNDCQEDGGGISGNISPFAKSRTPAAKKEKKKGGGGGEGEIKLGNVRRQDTMLRGGKSVAVIDSEAKDRAKADRQSNPMPSGSHPASTADLYDRTIVQREDPKRPAKITSYDPVFTESDLAQNGMFIAHESVARLLTSRHEDERRAAGGEGPAAVIDTRRDLSGDQFEYVVSAVKQDVDRAYEEGRNPGFYSTDISECMEVMSGFYPELSNADEAKRRGTAPEDAAFVFTMITAITSNGTDPALNLESADRIYRLYREHGSVRTPDEIMGGERAKEIKSALNRFQDMIDEFGESRARAVLSGVTHASTVTRTMKKLAKSSQEFGGSWSDKGIGSGELADEVVPVAAIFGPKIGSFFANLSGKHQFLTMDRWLMRSVGRVTGELITRSTPEAANKQANAAIKAIKLKPRSRDILFGVDKPPLSLARDDVIKSLELQARTGIVEENGAAYEWAKAAQRAFNKVPRGTRPDGSSYGSYGVDADPQVHAAHKAGNTLAKSLVHEQQDPRSARARRVIREVFREVAKRVSSEDPAARGKVQVSEVQAILWQYEQNLWKRLGAKTKIEGDSLYSAAAKALKQRRDSGEEVATLRPEKQKRPKSVRSADGAASEANEELDYQNQSGQDLWDNEFENSGVDFIEFFKELLEEELPSARSFFKSLTDRVYSARSEGEPSVTLRAGEARHLLPRIGFDAPIPAELRNSLPESLSHARTLIDLHVTKEGANWWRDNGTDAEVFLDTADHESPQNRAFDAFVRKFFHESRDLPVGSGNGWASSAELIKFDELWDELDSEGVWDEYDSEGLEFRSGDCEKDEGGRFAKGNDCAVGDGPPASLKDAVVRWKGSTSDIGLHVQDEIDGKPVPGSGTGKKLREMAASLLKEVKTNSEPAPTLYRGDDKSPEENSSPLLGWTSNKKVAEHWARVYGGQVYELEGATGLNLKKAVGETFDDGEDEWVVMNTRPKKSSRSADCGRDEGGKFGPKNDCASGDGYRGGHKAPRSDGYSKSADDVTGSWPDDIYSKDAGRLYGHGDPSIDNESAKIIKSLKGKPDETVRIYRAVPSNVDDMINPGDWVSINETYAKQHGESTMGGDYKVVSMTVPARHIFTDGNSIHEWGYDPRPKKKELRSTCEKDEGGRFAKGNDCASSKGSSQQIKKHVASSGGRDELYSLVAKHIGTKKGFFGKSESGLQKPSELSRELGIDPVNAKELDEAHARGSQRDREGIASAIANIAAFNALPDSPRQARYSVDTPRTMQRQYGGTLFSWMTTGAMYNPVSDTIHVTASKPTLGLQKRSHDAGYLSTPDDDHSLFHEHAHRDHYGELRKRFGDPPPSGKDSQDEWANSVLSGVGRSVAEEMKVDRAFAERVIPKISSVSSYAATDPFETVAEYTTAVRLGYMKNDPDLDRLCKAAFAPVPKKIARRKK